MILRLQVDVGIGVAQNTTFKLERYTQWHRSSSSTVTVHTGWGWSSLTRRYLLQVQVVVFACGGCVECGVATGWTTAAGCPIPPTPPGCSPTGTGTPGGTPATPRGATLRAPLGAPGGTTPPPAPRPSSGVEHVAVCGARRSTTWTPILGSLGVWRVVPRASASRRHPAQAPALLPLEAPAPAAAAAPAPAPAPAPASNSQCVCRRSKRPLPLEVLCLSTLPTPRD